MTEDQDQDPFNPVVIYHANCVDGFAAAWCFWKKFGSGKVDLYPGVYGDDPPDVWKRTVYMVDFSYKADVVRAMVDSARSVTLIDHHVSAINDTSEIPNLTRYVSTESSGAMLAWRFLNGDAEPPALLRHVEDRDLWRFAIPGTREVSASLFSYPYDMQLWDVMMSYKDEGIAQMIQEGAAIERKHNKDILELINVCRRRMGIGGFDVPVACLPYTMTSDAGQLLAVGEPFAACYTDTADYRIFGLRSMKGVGVDVSKVAEQYGGGGHVNAAGFKVPRDHELARA